MTAVNDLDLVVAVLGVAEEPGYVVFDRAVYVRGVSTEHYDTVQRAAVPDETAMVRQLVAAGHLKLGTGQRCYVLDRRQRYGRHVLVTSRGRTCRLRWSALKPLPGNLRNTHVSDTAEVG